MGVISTEKALAAVEFVQLNNKAIAPKVLVEEYFKTLQNMRNYDIKGTDASVKLALKVMGQLPTIDSEAIEVLNRNGFVNAHGELLPYVSDIIRSSTKGTSGKELKFENPIFTILP